MKKKIGVTCAGSLIGQGIIKSVINSALNETIEVVGFEYFTDTISSFWIKNCYQMPDILKSGISHETYIETLIGHIKKHDLKLLFIGMDFELLMMATYKQYIYDMTGCTVIVSPQNVIDIADDKYKTFLFLKKAGLNHPLTWLPDEKEQVVFPAIVKPRTGSRSVGVSIVNNQNELTKSMEQINSPMVQEKIGTIDDEYTCAILYLDDIVHTKVNMRRYLKDGNTQVAIHSPDTPQSIIDYVDDIAHALKPFGPCNFQLRVSKDGIPLLFEINARFSGTTYMRTLFGVNEVAYLIDYFLENKPTSFEPKYGKVIRYIEELYIPRF